VSSGLSAEIGGCIEDLKRTNADISWVRAANLHITLKFLGDTEEDRIRAIEEGLARVSGVCRSFSLRFSGVGTFPGGKRPRVVWVDAEDSQGLTILKQIVEDKLASIGIVSDDRPFSPHLTIGRVRSLRNLPSLLRAMEELNDRDFGMMDVQAFSLMRSTLRPTGAEYSPIKEFPLQKEDQ